RELNLPGGQESLQIGPGEIVPIIHNVSVAPGVRLDWGPVRLLGISRQGNVTTMVIYGEAGSPAELYFSVKGRYTLLEGSGDFQRREEEDLVQLRTRFTRSDVPSIYSFTVAGQKVRVMAVCNELVDRIWFVEKGVIAGPGYVGEVNGASVTAERPWP